MDFKELLALVSSQNPLQIRTDSRLVKDGDIFVAVRGTVCDGHDFISQAFANGAKYIICQKDRRQETEDRRQKTEDGRRKTEDGRRKTEDGRRKKCEIILVEDSAETAAVLAQAGRGNPACRLTNLAVTGTNGKTTVAFLVRSIIQKTSQKCGLIGTVIYDTCSGANYQSALTTPDCLDIAARQEEMVQNGAKYMVIEASSHALSQNRLACINFKAAAFTNLTGDHLDYHKTKDDYLTAKIRLFSTLSPDATAVLNKQSPEAEIIAAKTSARHLWYAIEDPADITAHIESMDINGTAFTIEYAGQTQKVRTSLPGLYNVSNCLAAAGLCLAADFDLETIAAGLSALQTTPGRLEKLNGDGFSVIIDYAHTDDALKNVLATLKPLCKGRLIVVFGCGGDRDRTKRPRMAKVAEQLADFIIVTSDNPRMENPDQIINDIIVGFERGPAIPYSELRATRGERGCLAGTPVVPVNQRRATKIIEPDRRKAIELAIKSATESDIVLIAGKGHETYQIIGTQKYDFSDKAVAEECIKSRIGTSGVCTD